MYLLKFKSPMMALNKYIFICLLLMISKCIYAQSPTGNFTSDKVAFCVGTPVSFTASGVNITSYSWNFGSGASPATAGTMGPHSVTYSTSGAKTISLTISGPGGSSTITKTNFVTVGFEGVKVMTYNLLNYPDNSGAAADSAARNPFFRTVLAATLPDILMVDEMNTQTGMNWFLSSVLNSVSSGYAAGTFINGPDTDNGIFYKSSKFSFLSNTRIRTALRDINEFKLIHTLTGDTLRVYGLHLKSSMGASEEAQRAAEVDSLRKVTDALSLSSNFIVCGDFNIYKSSESAYLKLKAVNLSNEGHVIDPLPLTGTWNNGSFAIYHSQSTRTRSFNNGSNGGMNDRFDMMLFSKAINLSGGMSYVANSTIAFGNDGNHYNDSINKSPNTAVSQVIANALHYGSDHLPVMANFDFELTNCNQYDIGATSLVSPSPALCDNPNQVLQVRIKNYGSTSIDISTSNVIINLQATNPSSFTQQFSKTLVSGILSVGDSLLVTFDTNYNMSISGNYTINASTLLNNDVNLLNDAMPTAHITVISNTPSITPSGYQVICEGTSQILNASNGVNYVWSTGATTASITVSDSGNYVLTVTDQNGCMGTSNMHIAYKYFGNNGVAFTENIGVVAGTTTLATHEINNGFANDNLTMSGSGDVRGTTPSLGYTTASGAANVFITNTLNKNFIIAGISTLGLTNFSLSFGIYKSTSASTGADLLVQVSADGVNYTSLSFSPLPSGASWNYVTVIGTIPSTANLRIQFKQNGTVTQYRIDDVVLNHSNTIPSITANGDTTFCVNDSVQLIASASASYLWSNGLTTQTITAKNTGNYAAILTSANGCSKSAPAILITANHCSFNIDTKIFIEGFYIGNGMMNAVVDPSAFPLLCDSIELQLAQPIPPYSILYNEKKAISVTGISNFSFTTLPHYNSYYLVVKHRNSIETWSKYPVLINSINTNFDFTTSLANRPVDLLRPSTFLKP